MAVRTVWQGGTDHVPMAACLPAHPPTTHLPQCDSRLARVAKSTVPATSCSLNAWIWPSASSWLRVTTSSFQLEGRRLPRCFTSRWLARTRLGPAAAAAEGLAAALAGGPLLLLHCSLKVFGQLPKARTLPLLSCVGLLGGMGWPSTVVPARCMEVQEVAGQGRWWVMQAR